MITTINSIKWRRCKLIIIYDARIYIHILSKSPFFNAYSMYIVHVLETEVLRGYMGLVI